MRTVCLAPILLVGCGGFGAEGAGLVLTALTTITGDLYQRASLGMDELRDGEDGLVDGVEVVASPELSGIEAHGISGQLSGGEGWEGPVTIRGFGGLDDYQQGMQLDLALGGNLVGAQAVELEGPIFLEVFRVQDSTHKDHAWTFTVLGDVVADKATTGRGAVDVVAVVAFEDNLGAYVASVSGTIGRQDISNHPLGRVPDEAE